MASKMSEEEMKDKLTDAEYDVLRNKGTEAPFSSELLENKEEGAYVCKVCCQKLFDSSTKFDSGTGWPSFDEVSHSDAIELVEDTSHGMVRTEVVCKNCGSHLGHLFDDGPSDTTGKRYCINGVCLDFEPAGKPKDEANKDK